MLKEPSRHKICYLAPDVALPAPRGSSVHVAELAKSLADLGNEVHVISRRIRREDQKTELMNGFTVHRVYRWILRPEGKSSFTTTSQEIQKSGILSSIYYFYLLTVFRLYIAFVTAQLISKHSLNLIIERETAFGGGAIASVFTRKPMILEIIGPRYSRMSALRSRTIFFYTETMLRDWVDRAKCISIPAGVNLSLFREDDQLRESQRKKMGLESDQVIIGYVGTFQDWHGIEDLLAALVAMRQKYPKLRALLVGPHYEPYLKISQSLGISDICSFLGAVDYDEVPAYVNACDIMVALYNPNTNSLRRKYGIGSPIKVLEYLACGKPTISTKVDPIGSIIHDKKDGLLVSPGAPREVEKCIEELILNPAKRLELAANGKHLAWSTYSWSSVALTMASHF
jgi:glycosyltransferase involved in cell wall biosynthesis